MSVPNGNYRIFCAGDDGSKRWLVTKNQNDVKVTDGSAITWLLENTPQGMTINVAGQYIDGDTKDGNVKLVTLGNAGSGVYWDVSSSGNYYRLRCLGTGSGSKRYLDGNTGNTDVYLRSDTSKSGSQWLLLPA